MTARDVEDEVLRPMQRLYLPPRHLRSYDANDPDAKDEALAEYRAALERFPREVLHRAWARLRDTHEFSIWPTPAAIRRLAEEERLRSGTAGEIEARRERAWQSAATYADAFMRRRQVAKQAAGEGWSGKLRAYVEAAAWVQAQLIEGLKGEGMSLPSELAPSGCYRSARDALAELEAAFARPVGEGRIDVAVPKGLVERWRREASEAPAATAPLPLETVLDRLRARAKEPSPRGK